MSLAFSPSDTIPVTYHAFGEYGFPTFGFLSLAKTRGVDRILDFNPTISVSYRNFLMVLSHHQLYLLQLQLYYIIVL